MGVEEGWGRGHCTLGGQADTGLPLAMRAPARHSWREEAGAHLIKDSLPRAGFLFQAKTAISETWPLLIPSTLSIILHHLIAEMCHLPTVRCAGYRKNMGIQVSDLVSNLLLPSCVNVGKDLTNLSWWSQPSLSFFFSCEDSQSIISDIALDHFMSCTPTPTTNSFFWKP